MRERGERGALLAGAGVCAAALAGGRRAPHAGRRLLLHVRGHDLARAPSLTPPLPAHVCPAPLSRSPALWLSAATRVRLHTGPCAFPACTPQQRPPWPPPHAAPRAHAREPKPERRRARRWQLLCFVVSVYVAASAAFAAAFWALHWASPDMLAGDNPAGMSLAEARAPLTAFAMHPGHCLQLVTGRGRSAAAQLPHCEKSAGPCMRPCVAPGGQRACRAASAPGPPRHAARGSPAQHAREPAWRLCCRAGVPLVLRHQPGHDRLRQLGAPRHGYRPALSGVAVPFPIGANIRLCRQGRWGLSGRSGCIPGHSAAPTGSRGGSDTGARRRRRRRRAAATCCRPRSSLWACC